MIIEEEEEEGGGGRIGNSLSILPCFSPVREAREQGEVRETDHTSNGKCQMSRSDRGATPSLS